MKQPLLSEQAERKYLFMCTSKELHLSLNISHEIILSIL
jgi:hypothetical protein